MKGFSIYTLMARFDNKTMLSLEDVCDTLGYAKQTAYNELSAGTFVMPMQKIAGKWCAHIQDVATFLDERREQAAEEFERHRKKMQVPAAAYR